MEGAFALYNSMKLTDLHQFWKKDTFSKLQKGQSWGVYYGALFKWGGAIFGIHGGVLGTHMKHFLPKKRGFLFPCLFDYEK